MISHAKKLLMDLHVFFKQRKKRAFFLNILLTFWTLFVIAGGIIILWPESARVPLVKKNEWELVRGHFFNNGEPAFGDLPASMLLSQEKCFWRSWMPGSNNVAGHLRSAPFVIECGVIELPIVGYPAAPGNKIYLENLQTHQKISLRYGNAHETWSSYLFKIPSNWYGVSLCVGAIAQDDYYIGLGTPFNSGSITAWKRSFLVCLAWHAFVCLFLLMLVAPISKLLKKVLLGENYVPSYICFPIALALVGYLLFFFYYFLRPIAEIIVFALLLSGIVLERQNFRKFLSHPTLFLLRRPTFLWWLFISGFFWTVLNAQNTISLLFQANYRFSPASWSVDNQLPIIIAAALSEGKSLVGLLGDWQVSDRPPALAGLLTPFHQFFRWFFSNQNTSQLGGWLTHLVGICVMASWVFPIWECLRRAGLSGKMRGYAVSILTISPFVFFNTIYIWPKMLSGSLAFVGWLFLDRLRAKSFSWRESVGLGLSFGLALMCHGSIFFGLSAIALLCLTRFFKNKWQALLLSAFISFTVLTPWLIFVKKVDPPGNALTKLTFAGTFGFREKNKSLFQTVKEAYKNDTFNKWRERKSQALKTFVGMYNPALGADGYVDEGLFIRRGQFYYLVFVLGLLLLPLCWGTYRYYFKEISFAANNNFSPDTFLRLSLLSILIQLAVSWDAFPVHHIAYNAVFCLHLAALIYLCQCSVFMRDWFFIVTAAMFTGVWLISPAFEFGAINIISFTASLLLLIILCFYTKNFRFQQALWKKSF